MKKSTEVTTDSANQAKQAAECCQAHVKAINLYVCWWGGRGKGEGGWGAAHVPATVLPTPQACYRGTAPLPCLMGPADVPACLDASHVHIKYATWTKKLTGIQKWFRQLDMPASVPHCSWQPALLSCRPGSQSGHTLSRR